MQLTSRKGVDCQPWDDGSRCVTRRRPNRGEIGLQVSVHRHAVNVGRSRARLLGHKLFEPRDLGSGDLFIHQRPDEFLNLVDDRRCV